MGSQQRNYLIHLPTHYQRTNDVAVPLVLDYHGWTGTAGMTVNYVKLEQFVISIILRQLLFDFDLFSKTQRPSISEEAWMTLQTRKKLKRLLLYISRELGKMIMDIMSLIEEEWEVGTCLARTALWDPRVCYRDLWDRRRCATNHANVSL